MKGKAGARIAQLVSARGVLSEGSRVHFPGVTLVMVLTSILSVKLYVVLNTQENYRTKEENFENNGKLNTYHTVA